MLLVDESFISRRVVESDEVSCESVALYRAIGSLDHGELCFFADGARCHDVAFRQRDQYTLARKELALEFVVHPVDL